MSELIPVYFFVAAIIFCIAAVVITCIRDAKSMVGKTEDVYKRQIISLTNGWISR